MTLELRELDGSEWVSIIGDGTPDPVATDPANVPGWGLPIWRDERTDRGAGVSKAKWNIRGTEVNNFDYATVDPAMVTADAEGYMHLKAEFLPTPQMSPRGGATVTAGSDDVITCAANHDLGVTEKVYVEHVSGGGIATGYYYVKSVPSKTKLTLTATVDMFPGGAGPTLNITAPTTIKLYRPRFMRTGYVDHRIIKAGDIAPYEQQYGRWEMRAKPPSSPTVGRGVLAAFWLRNVGAITTTGPAGAEIDMMETWGSGPTPKQDPGTSTLTFFKYTIVPTGGTQNKEFWRYDDAAKAPAGHNDAHLGFHVWTFERTPDHMKAWRDGVLICDETPATSPDSWAVSATNPFHVRLNLHMGPSSQYWGIPDPAHPEWTATPTDYVVDYVRIWRMPT